MCKNWRKKGANCATKIDIGDMCGEDENELYSLYKISWSVENISASILFAIWIIYHFQKYIQIPIIPF